LEPFQDRFYRRFKIAIFRGSIDESGDAKETDATKEKRSKVSSLNLTSSPPDPIIAHPSVLTAMLKLLPCLAGSEPEETGSKPDPESDRFSLALQFHLAETIKSLLRTEKNQQVNPFDQILSISDDAIDYLGQHLKSVTMKHERD
jgi:hypothetical protein